MLPFLTAGVFFSLFTCSWMIDKDTGKRCVTQMYWIPEETLERRVAEEKIPYDKWRDRGLLRTCAGNTINYKDVTAWFLEMAAEYKIVPAWVYYDAWSARYWVEEMKASGFNMIPCIQGAKTLARIENAAMLKLRRDETLKALHYAHFPDDPQDVFGHSPTPLNVVIAAENWEEWIERAAEELRGLENGL